MFSSILLVSVFCVHFAAPLSTDDFFYYPEVRFCTGNICLDFENDAVTVLETEPFPFYGLQSGNSVAVSAYMLCVYSS